ncbi:hypothetical protein CSB11_00390 [Candidatus Campbellbacteria bacterium]|nr:MAG: hypothetical protein CSB11_00390 [Candidatus Campbellbacteria bacterium]
MTNNNQTAILNITIPKNTKADFQALAKNMGTTPSNLIKMFITQSLNSDEITFSTNTENTLKTEQFSKQEQEDLLNNESIKNNISKM